MKKLSLFGVAAAAVLLSAASSLQAKLGMDVPNPSVVTTNDTFDIAVVGFNQAAGDGIFLVAPITATFNGLGAAGAQTFNGFTLDGQAVTVTTTQTITGTNVTDSIILRVTTNFIPAGTTTNSGGVIDFLELDMGAFNAGTNTLDFTPAITGTPTYAGSVNYGTNGASTLSITNQAGASTLTNNGASLSYYQAVSGGGATGLSQFAIRQFNFSVTYAVPEPSTYAFIGAGVFALGLVTVRRNRRAKLA